VPVGDGSHRRGLLAATKSWMAKIPVPQLDILVIDEIGKTISGAGMDTKVVNRSVNGDTIPGRTRRVSSVSISAG